MSSPPPPRRSTRKRTLTQVISDDVDTPPTPASFVAKVSQFAYSTSPASKRRAPSTRSVAKSKPDFSADANLSNEATTSTVITTKPKPLRTTKKKAPVLVLDTPHPAPPKWRETYEAITEMRKHILAPVDGMGCANAGDAEEDPKSKRLSILISLMLSSQTKDEVTHAAVAKLRVAAGGVITLDAMLAMDTQTLQGAINKVGFWPKKTTYIMEAMKKLRDDFDSDVPKTVEELTSLKGVGPKMGFLTLQHAWNLSTGIGVDVHVHRITNLLGWHRPATKTPEQTRLNLQSWLPPELWQDINSLLVGFGQGLCPSANVSTKGGKPRSPMKLGAGAIPFRGVTIAKVEEAVETIGDADPFASLIAMEVDRAKSEVEGGAPKIKIELEEEG